MRQIYFFNFLTLTCSNIFKSNILLSIKFRFFKFINESLEQEVQK